MAKPYGRIYNNNKNVSITPLDIKDLYPVGSIYLSINKTNPSTYFGGTWVQLYGGYLYAAQSSIGKTDYIGWGTQGHTLTTSQIPLHDHPVYQNNGSNYSIPIYGEYAVHNNTGYQNFMYTNNGKFTQGAGGQGKFGTGGVGGGGAHSHNIATVDVFVWKRTA